MKDRPLTKITKSEDGTRVFCEHQPGNMTKYVGTAFKIPKAVPYHGGEWVVSFPEHGSSYYIDEGQYISVGYAAEKFGRGRIRKVGTDSPDLHEMCKMICMMVPGVESDAETDETGHLPYVPPKMSEPQEETLDE